MYWLLASLLPVRSIAGIALLVLGAHLAGVDVIGIGLDLLGLPDWRWTGLGLDSLW
ncbi:hypothetical protein [Halobellus inordinatus]|uniref:hypothetical protein n=1 Tax=Halobellus inordinatus TaxID=1126236 RepID=UPI00210C36B7|nr:hypothetical protein [Halobellus inordinatus]